MTDLIFYNFRVSSKERLKRLALHLASIKFIGDQEFNSSFTVCIIIRGLYKFQAAKLCEIFIPGVIIRIGIENEPWKQSTYQYITTLFGSIHSFRRIIYLLEDWYFLGESRQDLINCINESAELSCCYTPVSVFRNAPIYEPWSHDEGEFLNTVHYRDIEQKEFQRRSVSLRNGWETYPIFCGGVYSPALFESLLYKADDHADKSTPFGMEYPHSLFDFNIKIGIIKSRLFVTFDDDQGHSMESMASRNLYFVQYYGSFLRLQEDIVDDNNFNLVHSTDLALGL